ATNEHRRGTALHVSITPAQCRAARALVKMNQEELAGTVRVPLNDIVEFETGSRTPPANSLTEIRTALESAGVIFVDENDEGPGVRLRKTHAQERQHEWSPTSPDGTQIQVGQGRRLP